MAINPEMIRDVFPIFQNSNLVYLDNAATTQKPQKVIDSISGYYSNTNANVHRGAYHLAMKSTNLYEGTRKKVKGFINAGTEKEIIFTSGTTEGINLVAYSFLENRLSEGDNIVITAMEHHSNLVPWQAACKRKNAELRVVSMNSDGELNLDEYANLLDDKTKIVATVHISNSLGTINPIEQIIETAHQKNIPVLIDAAQSIAHYPIDVQALNCDFLVFSGHKMYGPTGIGVLYGKQEFLEQMTPWQFGGEMIRLVRFEKTSYNQLPYKFEAGTPNIVGTVGLGAAIDFIQEIGQENLKNHIHQLGAYAHKKLSQIEGIKIIGTAKKKTGIVSFLYKEVHPHDISTVLNEKNIAVRAGHHCCQPVMQFYQIPGTTRASFAGYNTKTDIDRLVEAFDLVKKIFG